MNSIRMGEPLSRLTLSHYCGRCIFVGFGFLRTRSHLCHYKIADRSGGTLEIAYKFLTLIRFYSLQLCKLQMLQEALYEHTTLAFDRHFHTL